MTIQLSEIFPEAEYLDSAFSLMGIAEEEIEKAQVRHGEHGQGPIWRSFGLLNPTSDRLYRELLYRAHCREILDRVAKGEDTRPGTDAEMIVVLHETSLIAPLSSTASCLYFRLAMRSVPELARALGPDMDLPSYEKLHGALADDYEAELRRKTMRKDRKK